MITSLVVLLAVVVAMLTVLVIGLLRSYGEVLRRMHQAGLGADALDDPPAAGGAAGHDEAADIARRLDASVPAPPPAGAPSPEVVDVAGVTPSGDAVAVGLRGGDRVTMLAFLSSGCGTCAGFWAALRSGNRLQVDGREVRTVVVTAAPANETPAAVARLAGRDLGVVMSDDAWRHYAVPATPYFVLVDAASGIVGEGSAMTWPQLVGLLGRAVEDRGFELSVEPGDRSTDPTGSHGGRSPAGHHAHTMPSGMARSAERQAVREARADAALLAAGIAPGDERLYGAPSEHPGP